MYYRKNRAAKEKITFDPDSIPKTEIKIPKFKYKVAVDDVSMQTAFTGNVIGLPTVLIFYLHANELKVVCVILQEIMERGACILTYQQFSIRLCISLPTLYQTMRKLRTMNVIEELRKGWKVRRWLNFEAIQHLNDLVDTEDRGIYPRLRRKCKSKSIKKINEEDIKAVYDQYVLPPDHDIEEEEEYD